MRGNPDKTIPYRFKPGQSGNPGGRPTKRPITEAYERWANQRLPERLRRTLDRAGAELPVNATYADAAALGLLRSSIKGNAMALKEMREAIEGKVVDRVEVTQVYEQMSDAELMARAKARGIAIELKIPPVQAQITGEVE